MKGGNGSLQKGSARNFLKSIAFAVALCFTVTTVGWSAPSAPNTYLPQFFESGFESEVKLLSLVRDLEIPELLGTIEERHETSGPSIVFIQDAHASLEAQLNIQKILKHLSDQYDLNLLFLEGGVDELSAAHLKFFKEDTLNQHAAQTLAKNGVIGGPELFLLEDENARAFGVEDGALYRENVEAYRAVLNDKSVSATFLKALKAKILTASSRVLSEKLNRFFKEWLFYEDMRANLLQHLEGLASQAKLELGIDLRYPKSQIKWPQLVRVLKLQDLEKEMDVAQAEAERQKLLTWAGQNRIQKSFVACIEKFEKQCTEYEGKNNSVRFFFERFFDAASSKSFSYEQYPALTNWAGTLILRDELDARRLFDEIDAMTDALTQALAQSEAEQAFVAIYKDYLLLTKLFSLELTFDDFSKVQARNTELTPSRIWQRLLNISSPSLGGSNPSSDAAIPEHTINALFTKSLHFYKQAELRESAIFSRMARQLKASEQKDAILITGGFHSKGILDFLKKNGLSYALVTPRIGEVERANAYEDVMTLTPNFPVEKSYVRQVTPAFNNGLSGVRDLLGTQTADYIATQFAFTIPEVAAFGNLAYVDAFNQVNETHPELRFSQVNDAHVVSYAGQAVSDVTGEGKLVVKSNGSLQYLEELPFTNVETLQRRVDELIQTLRAHAELRATNETYSWLDGDGGDADKADLITNLFLLKSQAIEEVTRKIDAQVEVLSKVQKSFLQTRTNLERHVTEIYYISLALSVLLNAAERELQFAAFRDESPSEARLAVSSVEQLLKAEIKLNERAQIIGAFDLFDGSKDEEKHLRGLVDQAALSFNRNASLKNQITDLFQAAIYGFATDKSFSGVLYEEKKRLEAIASFNPAEKVEALMDRPLTTRNQLGKERVRTAEAFIKLIQSAISVEAVALTEHEEASQQDELLWKRYEAIFKDGKLIIVVYRLAQTQNITTIDFYQAPLNSKIDLTNIIQEPQTFTSESKPSGIFQTIQNTINARLELRQTTTSTYAVEEVSGHGVPLRSILRTMTDLTHEAGQDALHTELRTQSPLQELSGPLTKKDLLQLWTDAYEGNDFILEAHDFDKNIVSPEGFVFEIKVRPDYPHASNDKLDEKEKARNESLYRNMQQHLEGTEISGGQDVSAGLEVPRRFRLWTAPTELVELPYQLPSLWFGYAITANRINATIAAERINFQDRENSANSLIASPAVPINWANVIADLAIKALFAWPSSGTTVTRLPFLVNQAPITVGEHSANIINSQLVIRNKSYSQSEVLGEMPHTELRIEIAKQAMSKLQSEASPAFARLFQTYPIDGNGRTAPDALFVASDNVQKAWSTIVINFDVDKIQKSLIEARDTIREQILTPASTIANKATSIVDAAYDLENIEAKDEPLLNSVISLRLGVKEGEGLNAFKEAETAERAMNEAISLLDQLKERSELRSAGIDTTSTYAVEEVSGQRIPLRSTLRTVTDIASDVEEVAPHAELREGGFTRAVLWLTDFLFMGFENESYFQVLSRFTLFAFVVGFSTNLTLMPLVSSSIEKVFVGSLLGTVIYGAFPATVVYLLFRMSQLTKWAIHQLKTRTNFSSREDKGDQTSAGVDTRDDRQANVQKPSNWLDHLFSQASLPTLKVTEFSSNADLKSELRKGGGLRVLSDVAISKSRTSIEDQAVSGTEALRIASNYLKSENFGYQFIGFEEDESDPTLSVTLYVPNRDEVVRGESGAFASREMEEIRRQVEAYAARGYQFKLTSYWIDAGHGKDGNAFVITATKSELRQASTYNEVIQLLKNQDFEPFAASMSRNDPSGPNLFSKTGTGTVVAQKKPSHIKFQSYLVQHGGFKYEILIDLIFSEEHPDHLSVFKRDPTNDNKIVSEGIFQLHDFETLEVTGARENTFKFKWGRVSLRSNEDLESVQNADLFLKSLFLGNTLPESEDQFVFQVGNQDEFREYLGFGRAVTEQEIRQLWTESLQDLGLSKDHFDFRLKNFRAHAKARKKLTIEVKYPERAQITSGSSSLLQTALQQFRDKLKKQENFEINAMSYPDLGIDIREQWFANEFGRHAELRQGIGSPSFEEKLFKYGIITLVAALLLFSIKNYRPIARFQAYVVYEKAEKSSKFEKGIDEAFWDYLMKQVKAGKEIGMPILLGGQSPWWTRWQNSQSRWDNLYGKGNRFRDEKELRHQDEQEIPYSKYSQRPELRKIFDSHLRKFIGKLSILLATSLGILLLKKALGTRSTFKKATRTQRLDGPKSPARQALIEPFIALGEGGATTLFDGTTEDSRDTERPELRYYQPGLRKIRGVSVIRGKAYINEGRAVSGEVALERALRAAHSNALGWSYIGFEEDANDQKKRVKLYHPVKSKVKRRKDGSFISPEMEEIRRKMELYESLEYEFLLKDYHLETSHRKFERAFIIIATPKKNNNMTYREIEVSEREDLISSLFSEIEIRTPLGSKWRTQALENTIGLITFFIRELELKDTVSYELATALQMEGQKYPDAIATLVTAWAELADLDLKAAKKFIPNFTQLHKGWQIDLEDKVATHLIIFGLSATFLLALTIGSLIGVALFPVFLQPFWSYKIGMWSAAFFGIATLVSLVFGWQKKRNYETITQQQENIMKHLKSIFDSNTLFLLLAVGVTSLFYVISTLSQTVFAESQAPRAPPSVEQDAKSADSSPHKLLFDTKLLKIVEKTNPDGGSDTLLKIFSPATHSLIREFKIEPKFTHTHDKETGTDDFQVNEVFARTVNQSRLFVRSVEGPKKSKVLLTMKEELKSSAFKVPILRVTDFSLGGDTQRHEETRYYRSDTRRIVEKHARDGIVVYSTVGEETKPSFEISGWSLLGQAPVLKASGMSVPAKRLMPTVENRTNLLLQTDALTAEGQLIQYIRTEDGMILVESGSNTLSPDNPPRKELRHQRAKKGYRAPKAGTEPFFRLGTLKKVPSPFFQDSVPFFLAVIGILSVGLTVVSLVTANSDDGFVDVPESVLQIKLFGPDEWHKYQEQMLQDGYIIETPFYQVDIRKGTVAVIKREVKDAKEHFVLYVKRDDDESASQGDEFEIEGDLETEGDDGGLLQSLRVKLVENGPYIRFTSQEYRGRGLSPGAIIVEQNVSSKMFPAGVRVGEDYFFPSISAGSLPGTISVVSPKSAKYVWDRNGNLIEINVPSFRRIFHRGPGEKIALNLAWDFMAVREGIDFAFIEVLDAEGQVTLEIPAHIDQVKEEGSGLLQSFRARSVWGPDYEITHDTEGVKVEVIKEARKELRRAIGDADGRHSELRTQAVREDDTDTKQTPQEGSWLTAVLMRMRTLQENGYPELNAVEMHFLAVVTDAWKRASRMKHDRYAVYFDGLIEQIKAGTLYDRPETTLEDFLNKYVTDEGARPYLNRALFGEHRTLIEEELNILLSRYANTYEAQILNYRQLKVNPNAFQIEFTVRDWASLQDGELEDLISTVHVFDLDVMDFVRAFSVEYPNRYHITFGDFEEGRVVLSFQNKVTASRETQLTVEQIEKIADDVPFKVVGPVDDLSRKVDDFFEAELLAVLKSHGIHTIGTLYELIHNGGAFYKVVSKGKDRKTLVSLLSQRETSFAQRKKAAALQFESWRKQGIKVDFEWRNIYDKTAHAHTGIILKVTDLDINEPSVWVEGLSVPVPVSRILRAKPSITKRLAPRVLPARQAKSVDAKVKKVFQQFFKESIDPNDLSVRPLTKKTEASINKTYVVTYRGEEYVVQNINDIFDIDAINENLKLFEEAQAAAVLKNFLPSYWQKVEFLDVNTSDAHDKFFYDAEHEPWRVMRMLEGETFESLEEIQDPNERAEVARALGEAIAFFQEILKQVDARLWSEPLPQFHDSGYHLSYLIDLLLGKVRSRSLDIHEAVFAKMDHSFVDQHRARIEPLLRMIGSKEELITLAAALGEAIAHNDMKISNFLFKKLEGHYRVVGVKNADRTYGVTTVIDLDTIQKGSIFIDIADALRSASNTAGEDPNVGETRESHMKRVKINLNVARNIIEGYVPAFLRFNKKWTLERTLEGVYLLFRLLPFELGLRFLADSIAGNIYFKLADHEPRDQNLYRAQIQFLVEEKVAALNKELTTPWPKLRSIINKQRSELRDSAPTEIFTGFYELKKMARQELRSPPKRITGEDIETHKNEILKAYNHYVSAYFVLRSSQSKTEDLKYTLRHAVVQLKAVEKKAYKIFNDALLVNNNTINVGAIKALDSVVSKLERSIQLAKTKKLIGKIDDQKVFMDFIKTVILSAASLKTLATNSVVEKTRKKASYLINKISELLALYEDFSLTANEQTLVLSDNQSAWRITISLRYGNPFEDDTNEDLYRGQLSAAFGQFHAQRRSAQRRELRKGTLEELSDAILYLFFEGAGALGQIFGTSRQELRSNDETETGEPAKKKWQSPIIVLWYFGINFIKNIFSWRAWTANYEKTMREVKSIKNVLGWRNIRKSTRLVLNNLKKLFKGDTYKNSWEVTKLKWLRHADPYSFTSFKASILAMKVYLEDNKKDQKSSPHRSLWLKFDDIATFYKSKMKFESRSQKSYVDVFGFVKGFYKKELVTLHEQLVDPEFRESARKRNEFLEEIEDIRKTAFELSKIIASSYGVSEAELKKLTLDKLDPVKSKIPTTVKNELSGARQLVDEEVRRRTPLYQIGILVSQAAVFVGAFFGVWMHFLADVGARLADPNQMNNLLQRMKYMSGDVMDALPFLPVAFGALALGVVALGAAQIPSFFYFIVPHVKGLAPFFARNPKEWRKTPKTEWKLQKGYLAPVSAQADKQAQVESIFQEQFGKAGRDVQRFLGLRSDAKVLKYGVRHASRLKAGDVERLHNPVYAHDVWVENEIPGSEVKLVTFYTEKALTGQFELEQLAGQLGIGPEVMLVKLGHLPFRKKVILRHIPNAAPYEIARKDNSLQEIYEAVGEALGTLHSEGIVMRNLTNAEIPELMNTKAIFFNQGDVNSVRNELRSLAQFGDFGLAKKVKGDIEFGKEASQILNALSYLPGSDDAFNRGYRRTHTKFRRSITDVIRILEVQPSKEVHKGLIRSLESQRENYDSRDENPVTLIDLIKTYYGGALNQIGVRLIDNEYRHRDGAWRETMEQYQEIQKTALEASKAIAKVYGVSEGDLNFIKFIFDLKESDKILSTSVKETIASVRKLLVDAHFKTGPFFTFRRVHRKKLDMKAWNQASAANRWKVSKDKTITAIDKYSRVDPILEEHFGKRAGLEIRKLIDRTSGKAVSLKHQLQPKRLKTTLLPGFMWGPNLVRTNYEFHLKDNSELFQLTIEEIIWEDRTFQETQHFSEVKSLLSFLPFSFLGSKQALTKRYNLLRFVGENGMAPMPRLIYMGGYRLFGFLQIGGKQVIAKPVHTMRSLHEHQPNTGQDIRAFFRLAGRTLGRYFHAQSPTQGFLPAMLQPALLWVKDEGGISIQFEDFEAGKPLPSQKTGSVLDLIAEEQVQNFAQALSSKDYFQIPIMPEGGAQEVTMLLGEELQQIFVQGYLGERYRTKGSPSLSPSDNFEEVFGEFTDDVLKFLSGANPKYIKKYQYLGPVEMKPVKGNEIKGRVRVMTKHRTWPNLDGAQPKTFYTEEYVTIGSRFGSLLETIPGFHLLAPTSRALSRQGKVKELARDRGVGMNAKLFKLNGKPVIVRHEVPADFQSLHDQEPTNRIQAERLIRTIGKALGLLHKEGVTHRKLVHPHFATGVEAEAIVTAGVKWLDLGGQEPHIAITDFRAVQLKSSRLKTDLEFQNLKKALTNTDGLNKFLSGAEVERLFADGYGSAFPRASISDDAKEAATPEASKADEARDTEKGRSELRVDDKRSSETEEELKKELLDIRNQIQELEKSAEPAFVEAKRILTEADERSPQAKTHHKRAIQFALQAQQKLQSLKVLQEKLEASFQHTELPAIRSQRPELRLESSVPQSASVQNLLAPFLSAVSFNSVVQTTFVASDVGSTHIQEVSPEAFDVLVDFIVSQSAHVAATEEIVVDRAAVRNEIDKRIASLDQLVLRDQLKLDGTGTALLTTSGDLTRRKLVTLNALPYLVKFAGRDDRGRINQSIVLVGEHADTLKQSIFAKSSGLSATERNLVSQLVQFVPGAVQEALPLAVQDFVRQHKAVISSVTQGESDEVSELVRNILRMIEDVKEIDNLALTAEAIAAAGENYAIRALHLVRIASLARQELRAGAEIAVVASLIKRYLDEHFPDMNIRVALDGSFSLSLAQVSERLSQLRAMTHAFLKAA